MNDPKQTQPKSSAQSNWIGLLVLGFGALCLVAVGIIIYQSTSTSQQRDTVDVQQSQTADNASDQRRNDLSRSLQGIDSNQSLNANQQVQDQTIDGSQIRGAWETMMKDAMAGIIELSSEGYRIILSNDNPSETRLFSTGTYTLVNNNILILAPNNAARAPNDGFRYRPLYNNTFSVKLEKRGDYLVWTRPAPGSVAPNPPSHPILRYANDSMIIWNKF